MSRYRDKRDIPPLGGVPDVPGRGARPAGKPSAGSERGGCDQAPDLFAAAATRSQAEALATLDAWLAATDPQRGTIRPADPGYWPPPVRIADAFPPKPERVNGRAVPPTPFRKHARGPFRRAVAAL